MRAKHPHFPDYWIHADGSVVRAVDSQKYHKAGDVLRGRVMRSGYRQHKLVDANGNRRLVRTNRIVCEAFHGLSPTPKHHSAHRDGNKLNNSAENLYWATPKQNKADSIAHGTIARGERTGNQHGKAKLTAEKVSQIRAAYKGTKGDLVSLALVYGVAPTCIQKVVSGQTWKHVTDRMRAGQSA
jgi:hypothetical protein